MHARIGPFVMSAGECGACRGRGVSAPAPGRECGACAGSGSSMQPVPFAFDIPKGMREGHGAKFAGGGSFDARRRRHNDLELRGSLQIPTGGSAIRIVSIDGDSGRVTASLRITLLEMLGGFDRPIGSPWGKPMRATAPGYVRPDRPITFAGMGFPASSGELGELVLSLEIDYPDNHQGDVVFNAGGDPQLRVAYSV